jgi:DNA modification methylase
VLPTIQLKHLSQDQLRVFVITEILHPSLKKAFDTGGPGLHKLRLEVEKYEAMGTVVMNSAHRGDIRTEVSKSIRAEVAESVKTSRRPRAAVSLLLIVSAKSLSLETHTQFFKGVIMTRLLNSSRASSALKVPRASRRQLAIQYRPIGDLRLDPKNPRLHSSKQIAQIAASVSVFGFLVPALVDAKLNVIAGHGRVAAAQTLGLKLLPTIQLEHLSRDQLRAFQIADNRLTQNAQWDERLLGEQFRILAEAELDFSLEVTGFDVPEIDLLIENLTPTSDGDQDPADELPEPSPVQVSRSGDLWRLGKHRVLCGDALDEHSYSRVLGDECARVVFTDAPYNVPINGHVRGKGKTRHREFVMASGEMSEAEFTLFLTRVCILLVRYSHSGSLHFVMMDWRHMGELLQAGKQAYTELKNVCVWTKDTAGMGSLYRSEHELVFVFKSGKDPHRNNVQLGQFSRSRSNVWPYPGANSFARSGSEGNLLALHPTVKPVALVADAILDCSARGDLVLDPFLGSGTTIIAAERTGRVCFGMELDPIYIDTIVRRWQQFTGKLAVHQKTGRSFDEIGKERQHASR